MAVLKQFLVVLTSLLILPFTALSATHQVAVDPTPADGYEGEFKFASGFRSCYGDVSAGFGSEELTPTRYHYHGKTYTPADFGLEAFKTQKPSATIEADLYDGELRLGHLVFESVTFFSAAGCFTETFHVTKMLGLDDKDYRKKTDQLSLQNLTVKLIATDSKLEGILLKREAEEKAQQRERERVAEQEKKKKEQAEAEAKAQVKAEAEAKEKEQKEAETIALKKKEAEKGASAKTKTDSPAPKEAPSAKESTSSERSEVENRNREIELEKQRYAEEAFRQNDAQIQADKALAQGVSDSAGAVLGAAIAAGYGVGFGLISTDKEPIDSVSRNNLFAITIGKSDDPELLKGKNRLTSGTVFSYAFNFDILSPEPTPKTYSLGSANSKLWKWMAEFKKFGNFESMNQLQPFLGLGLAEYSEYTAKLEPVKSDTIITTSVGIVVVKTDGWFSMGWNLTLNAIDFGFGF